MGGMGSGIIQRLNTGDFLAQPNRLLAIGFDTKHTPFRFPLVHYVRTVRAIRNNFLLRQRLDLVQHTPDIVQSTPNAAGRLPVLVEINVQAVGNLE